MPATRLPVDLCVVKPTEGLFDWIPRFKYHEDPRDAYTVPVPTWQGAEPHSVAMGALGGAIAHSQLSEPPAEGASHDPALWARMAAGGVAGAWANSGFQIKSAQLPKGVEFVKRDGGSAKSVRSSKSDYSPVYVPLTKSIFDQSTVEDEYSTIALPLKVRGPERADIPQAYRHAYMYRVEDLERVSDDPESDGQLYHINLTFPSIPTTTKDGEDGLKIPRLGIETASRNDLGQGLVVLNVEEDSVAERCGVKVGDVMLQVFDVPLKNMLTSDAARTLANCLNDPRSRHWIDRPGTKGMLAMVPLQVWRQCTYVF